MQLIDTVQGFTKSLQVERSSRRSVGLVPTMGFLHQGHLSLIRRAREECDSVAVTLFVNPLQFGPGDDLDSYPRDWEGDLASARAAGADYLFVPPPQEMFPAPPVARVELGKLAEVLEGRSRPGHLNGVATVVAKLFAMAGPCRAYFGEKDYQQLVVVRHLVSDLSFPVEVIACPTARQRDGLALSSRNSRLNPEEREAATVLRRALARGEKLVRAGKSQPAAVELAMAEVVATEPLVSLDYAAVVDAATLERVDTLVGELRLLLAARVGPVRLIDNVGVVAP